MNRLICLPMIFAAFIAGNIYCAETNSFDIFVKTLTGTTLQIAVVPSDSMLTIKQHISRMSSVPVDGQRLIYAGKALENNVLISELSIQKESTIHLTISLQAVKNLQYGAKYASAVKNAREVLASLKSYADLKNGTYSEFFYGVQDIVGQLDALFSYKLPADFYIEVAADLSKRYALFLDDMINSRDDLYDSAMSHLRININPEQEDDYSMISNYVSQWKESEEKLKTYLKSRIAYNITLARMLGDQKINYFNERFFSTSSEFIDLYNNKETLNFNGMLAKYEALHWQQ